MDLWSGERAFGRADAQRRNGLKGEEVLRNPGGGSEGLLRTSLGFLDTSYGRLGGLLGASWVAFWDLFGAPSGLLGALGASWAGLRGV